MSDWDDLLDSDSDNAETKNDKNAKEPKKASQAADDWDDSDESAEEQPKTTKAVQNNANDLDESEESETEQTEDSKTKTQTNGDNVFADAEKMKKLQKKMQNYKKRQKKKKKKKKKPVTQQSVNSKSNKKNDKANDSSSDSSDDDNKGTKNKKMESYADRMKTDNDILFEGHKNPSKPKPKDDRIMLSGEVTLKNFPLGSSKDCENLAGQVSALLDQKLFEEHINANDIFLFYKKLLSSDIIEKLDMVDTKALATKMNGILTSKQKAWHKKKNPSFVCLYFESLHTLIMDYVYNNNAQRENQRKKHNGWCQISLTMPHRKKWDSMWMEVMIRQNTAICLISVDIMFYFLQNFELRLTILCHQINFDRSKALNDMHDEKNINKKVETRKSLQWLFVLFFSKYVNCRRSNDKY